MTLTWHPKAGDCLLIDSGPTGKHLFVLILNGKIDNQIQAILVPVCTVRDSARIDETCLLQEGDHPFIAHDSFIEYRNSRIERIDHLLKGVKERVFIPHQPASKELLSKIKSGLMISKQVKRHIKDILSAVDDAPGGAT